eukprot:s686_g12.t1
MELGPCRVCECPALARCSRCQDAVYCGPECQRADWQIHKQSCGRSREVPAERQMPAVPGQAVPPKQKEIEWDAVRAMLGQAPAARPSDDCADEAAGPAEPRARWQSPATQPTTPAPFDVHLVGKNNVEVAQAVVAKLKERGVCVIKAGAERKRLPVSTLGPMASQQLRSSGGDSGRRRYQESTRLQMAAMAVGHVPLGNALEAVGQITSSTSWTMSLVIFIKKSAEVSEANFLRLLFQSSNVPGCYLRDARYLLTHLDHVTNPIENVFDFLECQMLCSKTAGCGRFVYLPSKLFCYLGAGDQGVVDAKGAVSGPAVCPEVSDEGWIFKLG